jgi:hypothetical protein
MSTGALRELLDNRNSAGRRSRLKRCGEGMSPASHQAVRRALIGLVQKGLIQKGISRRYHAFDIEQVYGSNLGR